MSSGLPETTRLHSAPKIHLGAQASLPAIHRVFSSSCVSFAHDNCSEDELEEQMEIGVDYTLIHSGKHFKIYKDTELHRERNRGNIESILPPCFLCDLCASVVKSFTVP